MKRGILVLLQALTEAANAHKDLWAAIEYDLHHCAVKWATVQDLHQYLAKMYLVLHEDELKKVREGEVVPEKLLHSDDTLRVDRSKKDTEVGE